METVFSLLTLLSAVGIAVGAIWGAVELRKISGLLTEIVYGGYTTNSPFPDDEGPGEAVFVGKGGQWTLAADMSRPGYRASPPTMEPSFEDQVVKRTSVRSEDRSSN